MFISNCDYTKEIGRLPTAKVTLVGVSDKDIEGIAELYKNGGDVEIHRAPAFPRFDFNLPLEPVPTDIRPITATDYVRRYEEMTAALNNYRGRVNKTEIIFTPRDIKVEKVIFNKPATIVFWSDNTKTVVVCGKDDTYDKEKGFFIACAKKLFGNDYKAVGRMNKALEMAEDKNE